MTQQVFWNGVTAGSVYALIALGFSLAYSATRFFNFAHAVILTIGAYLAFTCVESLGLPLAAAIPCAALGAGAVGAGLELAIYRPLRARGSAGLVLALASLGLFVAIQNVIPLLFGNDVRVLQKTPGSNVIAVFNARLTTVQVWSMITSASGAALVWLALRFTRSGKELRAVSCDPLLALAWGINTQRVILSAFGVGSMLAGLAGILIALDVAMSPTMGLNPMMIALVAMIIGGIGSVPGIFLGGLLLGLVQHLVAWYLGSRWQDPVVFLMLIGFLMVRPQGFFGKPFWKAGV